jgi:transcriptional regulator with XRE-family HTH domain
MDAFLSKNLRHLRRKNDRQTQEELANALGLTRSVISAYEDGRAEPNVATLIKMSSYFKISIDSLSNLDLARVDEKKVQHKRELERYASDKSLKVKSIKVELPKQELVCLVPLKASAGYTSGYADPEYLRDLPSYRLPFLSKGRIYRAFEIQGDSMLPLQDGSIVIAEQVEGIQDIKDGQVCVVVSKSEGIVLKRVYNRIAERGTIILKSENVAYSPYEIPAGDVVEIWKFTAFICDKFPEEYDATYDLKRAFSRIEQEFQDMKIKQAR